MKTKNLSLLPALIAVLNLLPAGRVTAQTFTTLHSFTTLNINNNSDGANPYAGLILSGNTLYGTAYQGGSSGHGTVFAVSTDGTGFTNLYNFSGPPSYPEPTTNSDGAFPSAGLLLSGATLYGTAYDGGSSGAGTVFAVNTDGTGFTNLHSFTRRDGYHPQAGLILSANTLYGTARYGGGSFAGTVFALNTDGTGFTNLYSFAAGGYNSSGYYTNSDGAFPIAALILSDNTLYATAVGGSSAGNGTVFALNTDGTGFTNLHNFTALNYIHPGDPPNNSDGANPSAGLILSGSTLYGTAAEGGGWGNGTVFGVNTNGTGFTNLHSFTYRGQTFPYDINGDGAYPYARLILSGSTLYGTAAGGGSSGNGTVFAVNTDGTGFTNLHSFTGGSDGANPYAGLTLSGNTLYGTAQNGGSSGYGTVFSISFRPQLTIVAAGRNVVLSWPTNVAGFDYTGYTLQSTTNLVSPVVWSSNSPAPVVIGGQNTVTNPITGPQQFYRLVQ